MMILLLLLLLLLLPLPLLLLPLLLLLLPLLLLPLLLLLIIIILILLITTTIMIIMIASNTNTNNDNEHLKGHPIRPMLAETFAHLFAPLAAKGAFAQCQETIVAIFYPFSQFCEIDISLLGLQTQPNTAQNLFQRGVEYGKYGDTVLREQLRDIFPAGDDYHYLALFI